MSITLGWPQIIYLFLFVAGMGVGLARFGEEKRGRYGWIDVLIAPAIALGLLYSGGFFG